MSLTVLLRSVHIICGSIAVMAGVIALATAKGGRDHRRAGQAFVIAGRALLVAAWASSIRVLFDVEPRIGSTPADMTRDEFRDLVRTFFALLAVLGLLAASDLERGFAALRARRGSHLRPLALISIVSGAALVVWGVRILRHDFGGLAWFAIVIGVIGVSEGSAAVRRGRPGESMPTHAAGMIDSLGGFVAAFVLFGAGRVLPFDFLAGDTRILIPIGAVLLATYAVKRFWLERIGRVQSSQQTETPNSPDNGACGPGALAGRARRLLVGRTTLRRCELRSVASFTKRTRMRLRLSG